MAKEKAKKSPDLSGFGAAYKAARAKYEESGGTDPYAKSAQFPYNGKVYNVAKTGEEDLRAPPVNKISSPAVRIKVSKTRPADMTPDKKPAVGIISARQYRDKAKETAKSDPLVQEKNTPTPYWKDPELVGPKRAKPTGPRSTPFGSNTYTDSPEKKAEKAAAARVDGDKALLAKLRNVKRPTEDTTGGMKKGGKVKAKPLPFWMSKFKKGAKPGDKAKPGGKSEGPMKFAKGGRVSRGNGCAQRGFK